ncbi:hypothetical protein IGJ16_002192 [Enterococcus pernyi]
MMKKTIRYDADTAKKLDEIQIYCKENFVSKLIVE